jgi:hypothetical protein
VQVVGGGNYGKKKEQQADQRNRKLKDRLGASTLSKPEVGSRPEQQKPAQVKK